MRKTLQILLLSMLVCGLSSHAMSHILPDVEFRLVSPLSALQTDDTYEGEIEIIAGEPGTISELDLYGEGWRAHLKNGAAIRSMSPGDRMTVEFTVDRAAPDTRLEFSIDFDGHPILFPIDLSERNIRAMKEGAPVTAVPDYMATAGDPSRQETYATLAAHENWLADHVNQQDSPEDMDRSGDGTRRTVNIFGRFGCTQQGGGFFPAHSITVEIWDQDLSGDDLLGTTSTNFDGYYNLNIDSNDAGRNDEPDIYVKFILKNNRVRVYEPTTGYNHGFATSVHENFTGTSLDFGTLQPADPDLQTTVYFHTQASRAWVFNNSMGYDVPQCRIEYPSANWPNCSSSGRIQMRDDFAFNDGTLWHEYGHWFDHEMSGWESFSYCNGICDASSTECGHCLWCQENQTVAWLEGWANFHSWAVGDWTPDLYGHDPLAPLSFETLRRCSGTMDVPLLTEGFISALGQDIADGNQDYHVIYGDYRDSLILGVGPIFAVCVLDNPGTSQDFLDSFYDRYPMHREGLWETAANCGFILDSTEPGIVTNLTSTSHAPNVPSPDPTATFTWTRASDDFSGIQGYGLFISNGSPGPPAAELDIGDVTTYTTESLSPGTYFFNIKSVDNAGNWDSGYATWGPIIIRDAEPADLTPYLPSNWAYELVPRVEYDATPTYAPLSPLLPGNTTGTYWNLFGVNQGEAATNTPFQGSLNIDGLNVQNVSWGTVDPYHTYWAGNWGPVYVAGGRHSFTCRHDGTDQIPEIDETNNIFGRQFVWEPLSIPSGVTVNRPGPEAKVGGWDEVTTGPSFFNCDGLRMPTSGGYWHAMAVWATDNTQDLDCRIHEASTGSDHGFTTHLGYSAKPAGNLDIVIANKNVNSAANWDVGVLGQGDSGDYNAYHAFSNTMAFGDSLDAPMAADQPVLLREFYVSGNNTGPLSVTAQSSTDEFITLVVFSRNFSTGTPTNAHTLGSAVAADGDLARVTFETEDAGWYGIMVYGDPDDGFPARNITIEAGAAPPDLAVRNPAGWWSAFVPRPADDGSSTSVPLPDTLQAAPSATYYNVAAQNAGLVPAILKSRVYRNDLYQGWIDWGELAPGTNVHFNWDAVFTTPSGRNTLSFRVDPSNLIEETNENNNIWAEQWVWGPQTMFNGDHTNRDAPPSRYGGFADVAASGGPFYINCDGLRMEGTGTSYWTALAIRPEGDSDYDLRIHEPASGAKNGYDTAMFGSYAAGTVTEYVLVDHNTEHSRNFDVSVINWSGNDNYNAHVASSVFHGSPAPSYIGMSLDNGELISLQEFRLPADDVSIRLENLSGRDLGMAIHRSGTPFHRPDLALAGANFGGPGEDESISLSMVEDEFYYCVVIYRADDSTGRIDFNLHFNIGLSPVGDQGVPQVTRLTGAFPNPFNPQTRIDFDLSQAGRAKVVIYDVQGRVIKRLADEDLTAGSHFVNWMGTDDTGRKVASGLYFARLESADGSDLTKLVLIK